MMCNSVSPSLHGNAQPLDDTIELQLQPKKITKKTQQLPLDEESLICLAQMDSPLFPDIDWRRSCITYTAGFVSKKVEQQVKCNQCAKALFQDVSQEPHHAFLNRKNNGGLCIPSKGVIDIVEACEKAFRIIMPSPALMESLPSNRYVDLHMQTMVFSHLLPKHQTLFPSLADHFFHHDPGVEENHISQLIKKVASVYINIKLLKAAKLFRDRQILKGKTTTRMKLNKLTLFSGH